MPALRYDLTDLRLFVTIVEAGSLTRGAERSYLSLGAASTRVKNLEEALGTQLLIRSSQGVALTPAGDVLKAHALRIFQEIERLHGNLQAFSGGLKGCVRIFANTTAITEVLPAALSAFLAAHPLVDVDLEERLSPEIARAVADGAVDIGILAGTVQTEGLEIFPYHRDRLVLAVSNSHPLASCDMIAFSEALSESFVSLQRDSAIHGFLSQILNALGATLNIRIKVSSFEALCRMVEANVGVGLLPDSVAMRLSRSHDIRIVQLSDPWAERALKICVRNYNELPAFMRELVDFLVSRLAPAADIKSRAAG